MQLSVQFNEAQNLRKYNVSGCSSSRKVILHLCADLGSDSLFYQKSDEYEVLTDIHKKEIAKLGTTNIFQRFQYKLLMLCWWNCQAETVSSAFC